MIKLFRQFRKRLLPIDIGTDNKFSKYLLYAVGEIVLVVIGILIALQINNWQEWKKERRIEQEILQNLVQNLELHIETLEADIERLTLLDNSAQIVVNVLDNRLPFKDSLAVHFHRARVPRRDLSLSQAGYEQYKNKGFDVILNSSIKEEVINYFESTLPTWITSYKPVNYINESFYDHHVPLFYYQKQSLTPIDMEILYTDSYFIGWIKAYMEGRHTLMELERDLLEEIGRILHLMRQETGAETSIN